MLNKKIKRVKTHISGFDELIEGGFPDGSSIVIRGEAGTGKTIISLEFLYNGAKFEKEKGIFFTFEEKRDSLISQGKQLGLDIESLERKGLIKIISFGINNIDGSTVDEMIQIVKATGARRVVIDSITTLSYLVSRSNSENAVTGYDIKKFLYEFIAKFKEVEIGTSLFISQIDEKISDITTMYVCDGIITLRYETLGGDFSRSLTISKMRITKNDEGLFPVEFTETGVKVHRI